MRERDRERSILPEITAALRAQRERSFTGKVVIPGKNRPFSQSTQGQERYYLTPSCYTGVPATTVLDNWIVFVQNVSKHSGKHRHQGGLVIYIIEGEGHTVVDGEALEWEAGDLMILPIRPSGCEHQHFNKHEDKPVKWIAFIHTAIYEWCASEMVQVEKHPEWRGNSAELARASQTSERSPVRAILEREERADDIVRVLPREQNEERVGSDTRIVRLPQTALGIPPANKPDDLLEWLFMLRDHQRKHTRNAPWLIRGNDVPWESNRQGLMQWYLHPALEHIAIRTMMFFRQEIPPRSWSGAQRSPGGQVIYIIRGRGYTLLDGVRYDWEEEDVVNIPIRMDGVTVQHFNIDKVDPVIMICADLNLAEIVGIDRGSEFEQTEVAPTYRTGATVTCK